MQEFEQKKANFFTNLGLSVRDSIKLQMKFGLFERDNLRRKHQAPEHMLVVTARTLILGEWLGLSEETIKEISLAASIHDAFKAKERAITKPLNFTWESFEIVEAKEIEELTKLGASQRLIDLARAAGHPLNEAQEKLALASPSEFDWAWMIIFYVDNYTSGVSWASENPIEERFARDKVTYSGFDNSAIGKIEGHPNESGFSALVRVGKEVQGKIAQRLGEIWEQNFDPEKLPLMIDGEIKKRIESISTRA